MFINSLSLLYTIIVNNSRRKLKKEKNTVSALRPYITSHAGKGICLFPRSLLTNRKRFAKINLTENKVRSCYGKQVQVLRRNARRVA